MYKYYKKKGFYFSINDYDQRSKNKSHKILLKKKIITSKFLLKKKGIKFYESYYRFKKNKPPIIDAKIALSNDYYTKDVNKRWITNERSRKLTHLLRSKYNAILTTSKTINDDNSLLDCRIDGLTDKSPDLIILDRNLKIKKKLNIFKKEIKRKIFIHTTRNNKKKIDWLKKNKVKVVLLKSMSSKKDYNNLFQSFTKKGYSRIFIEAGLTFINFLINSNFLDNIYIFKTSFNLKNNGFNKSSNKLLKKIKLKNKLKINLDNDIVYKEKL